MKDFLIGFVLMDVALFLVRLSFGLNEIWIACVAVVVAAIAGNYFGTMSMKARDGRP